MEMYCMSKKANVALVAHDGKKAAMLQWAAAQKERLGRLTLFATGTTGSRLKEALDLDITCLKSGPLGGDAQLGAMIAEGRLDALIFFIDPLSALPHDVDVKSLLRLAVHYDTALAPNEPSADAILDWLSKDNGG
jgi:methylglyoxal synthase